MFKKGGLFDKVSRKIDKNLSKAIGLEDGAKLSHALNPSSERHKDAVKQLKGEDSATTQVAEQQRIREQESREAEQRQAEGVSKQAIQEQEERQAKEVAEKIKAAEELATALRVSLAEAEARAAIEKTKAMELENALLKHRLEAIEKDKIPATKAVNIVSDLAIVPLDPNEKNSKMYELMKTDPKRVAQQLQTHDNYTEFEKWCMDNCFNKDSAFLPDDVNAALNLIESSLVGQNNDITMD